MTPEQLAKRKASQKAWREANKDYDRTRQRTWEKKHPERLRLSKLRYFCKTRNLPFDLEEIDLMPPQHCPVLGIELDRRDMNHTPSVDRIDPTGGYTKANICVISMKANNLKKNATLKELRQLVAYVESHQKSIPPSPA
jgi:hypothetical protein